MRKKCLAVFMGVVIFFFGTGALRVSADTLSPTINGISFSAYSNISDTFGSAGTVSGSHDLYTTVSSTYSYVNPWTLETGTMRNRSSNDQAATVSFNAPDNYRSVKISSYHTASSGAETWTGSTSATY